MESRAWIGMLSVGAATALASALTLQSIGPFLALAFGLAASALLSRRLRSMTSEHDRPWRKAFIAGLLVYAAIVLRIIHGVIIGEEFPIPSLPADLVVLAIYYMIVRFEFELVRLRDAGRDIDAWLDAVVATLAVGAVIWISVLSDYVLDGTVDLDERVANTGYFLLSLILLASTIRMMAAPGLRGTVYYLLAGGGACMFLADLAGTIAIAQHADGSVLIAAIPLVLGLSTAALLHPNRPDLTAEPDDLEPTFRAWRAMVLSLGITLPWGLIFLDRSTIGSDEVASLVLVGPILVTLILWRILRLIRGRELLLHQADQLRLAGDALLSNVVSPTEIADVTERAIGSVVTATPLLSTVSIEGVDPRGTAELLEAIPADADWEHRGSIEHGDEQLALFAVAIRTKTLNLGWIAIATQNQSVRHDRQAVRALAREASMALEGSKRAAAVAEAEAERRFTRAIVESERRQRALLLRSSDIVAVLSDDWTISYLSPPIHDVLGYQPVELVGSSLRHLLSGESLRAFEELIGRATSYGTSSGEVPLLHRDGEMRYLQLMLGDHRDDPDIEGIVINGRDLSATRALEEQLDRDPVTGALNRDAFIERADRQISVQPTVAGHRAIMVLEVEEVDLLTSASGYESSDALLLDIADRLRSNLRIGDDVARISGSTFAILLDRVLSAADLAELGDRIVTDVGRPIGITSGEVELVVRAGAVLCLDPLSAGEFLSQALAARAAATKGSAPVAIYEEGIEDSYRLQLELRTRMRQALETGEFFLHYQPIFDLQAQRVVGAEALARWVHPERGPVGPDVFIPEAERSGLITELGEWVIRTASSQVATWQAEGLTPTDFSVAVNVSAGQLNNDLVPLVRSVMDDEGLEAHQIRIELTESMFTDNDEFAAQLLGELSADGHRLAIDDFGTGTSNLARLGQFSIDYVKLDRSLIAPLDSRESRSIYLVENTLRLIESIGADAIAEGIETATQAMLLRNLGCRLVQGYFYGRPCSAENFRDRFLIESIGAGDLALSNR